jgi:glutathione S-transferase
MITVHHLNSSRSQRVLWLLEELGAEYEIKRYQRDPKTMLAPASLRAVHPLGKSPVITEKGLTIAESGAIIEYLIERHGKGRLSENLEKGPRDRIRALTCQLCGRTPQADGPNQRTVRARTFCATRSRRICCKAVTTSGRCRNCSATPTYRPP